MADPILIDTDILIDLGRGESAAIACIESVADSGLPTISVVTQLELIVGCRNKRELQLLDRFLGRFHILQLNPLISTRCVDLLTQYRLSHGLLIADGLIASTALVTGIPFVSKNQRDYRFIDGLDLLPYPEPFGPHV